MNIATPMKMFEFTVNMQNVRMPMWSKFSSYSVVRFMTTPTHTQTTTAAENSSVRRHFLRLMRSICFMTPNPPVPLVLAYRNGRAMSRRRKKEKL